MSDPCPPATTARVKLAPVIALVIASMIGTGVFTSLGYQLVDLTSAPVIMLVWLIGGLLAFCGALCYGELAGAMPRSGGEYHFLGRIYHPSLGWAAGCMSVIAGFSAPTAIAAIALGGYAQATFPALRESFVAYGAIIAVTLIHLTGMRSVTWLQTISTALKILLIVGFIIAAFLLPGNGDVRWHFDFSADLAQVARPAFAIALLYVFYAYSGWNAATYIIDEIADARRVVVRALLIGSVLVIVMYLLLNLAFLRAAPVAEMIGVKEVAFVAAKSSFGAPVARAFGALLSLGLIATVSALMWAGPRVIEAIGRDHRLFRPLATRTATGVPARAILLQCALAILFIQLGNFDQLMRYTQTGLTLGTFMAVAGVFVIRHRGWSGPGTTTFRCPWHPLPALCFLAMTGFVLVRILTEDAGSALLGLVTYLVTWAIYFPLRKWNSALHQ